MLKKQKFVKYILLNIITFGIYGLFFWYRWTENVNKVCDGDDKDSANYVLVLLLDIFSLGIYIFVWNFQMAQRLYQKAPDYGKTLKHGGAFVMIWRFFLPIVSSFFKIKYCNELIESDNLQFAPDAEEAPAVEAAPEAAPAYEAAPEEAPAYEEAPAAEEAPAEEAPVVEE